MNTFQRLLPLGALVAVVLLWVPGVRADDGSISGKPWQGVDQT